MSVFLFLLFTTKSGDEPQYLPRILSIKILLCVLIVGFPNKKAADPSIIANGATAFHVHIFFHFQTNCGNITFFSSIDLLPYLMK